MSKERLEEIIKQYSAHFIVTGRSIGKSQFRDNLNWLIQQAERVQELEQDREYLQGVINNASKRMQLLIAENETLSAQWNDAQKEILVLNNKLECEDK